MTQMGCKACVMATPNHHESIDQFAGKHGMQSSLQPFELYHDECSSVSHACKDRYLCVACPSSHLICAFAYLQLVHLS